MLAVQACLPGGTSRGKDFRVALTNCQNQQSPTALLKPGKSRDGLEVITRFMYDTFDNNYQAGLIGQLKLTASQEPPCCCTVHHFQYCGRAVYSHARHHNGNEATIGIDFLSKTMYLEASQTTYSACCRVGEL